MPTKLSASEFSRKFAERLIALRMQKGWTQAELGRLIGMSRANYEKVEQRGTIRNEYLSVLALALDISVDELLAVDKALPKLPRARAVK